MAPLGDDQDLPSWVQLLSAIENAEAGRGTASLAELCLSCYSALAVARFQVTQLRARVHVLSNERTLRAGQYSGRRRPHSERAC